MLAMIGAMILLGVAGATAQPYPARPIRLIVGSSAAAAVVTAWRA